MQNATEATSTASPAEIKSTLKPLIFKQEVVSDDFDIDGPGLDEATVDELTFNDDISSEQLSEEHTVDEISAADISQIKAAADVSLDTSTKKSKSNRYSFS